MSDILYNLMDVMKKGNDSKKSSISLFCLDQESHSETESISSRTFEPLLIPSTQKHGKVSFLLCFNL